jgi:hypothetical protein
MPECLLDIFIKVQLNHVASYEPMNMLRALKHMLNVLLVLILDILCERRTKNEAGGG